MAKYKFLSQTEFDQIKGLFGMKFSTAKICEITGRSYDTVNRVRLSETLEQAKAIAAARFNKKEQPPVVTLNGEFHEALKKVAELTDELSVALFNLQVEAGKAQKTSGKSEQVKPLT